MSDLPRGCALLPRGCVLLRILLALGVSMGAGACSDTVPVSAPGTLTATVVSPNGAEGAALIHLVGGGITSVAPLNGDLYSDVVGDTTRVVVLLDTPGEIAFQVSVADTTRRPVSTLLQVADGANQVRSGVVGYRVRFSQ